jgi:hypothetical protein
VISLQGCLYNWMCFPGVAFREPSTHAGQCAGMVVKGVPRAGSRYLRVWFLKCVVQAPGQNRQQKTDCSQQLCVGHLQEAGGWPASSSLWRMKRKPLLPLNPKDALSQAPRGSLPWKPCASGASGGWSTGKEKDRALCLLPGSTELCLAGMGPSTRLGVLGAAGRAMVTLVHRGSLSGWKCPCPMPPNPGAPQQDRAREQPTGQEEKQSTAPGQVVLRTSGPQSCPMLSSVP